MDRTPRSVNLCLLSRIEDPVANAAQTAKPKAKAKGMSKLQPTTGGAKANPRVVDEERPAARQGKGKGKKIKNKTSNAFLSIGVSGF